MLADCDILNPVHSKFKPNIIDIEECWHEGHRAASAEEDEFSNPYLPHTKAHQFWQDGWWAGFYEEQFDFSKSPAQAQAVSTTERSTKKLSLHIASLVSCGLLSVYALEWANIIAL